MISVYHWLFKAFMSLFLVGILFFENLTLNCIVSQGLSLADFLCKWFAFPPRLWNRLLSIIQRNWLRSLLFRLFSHVKLGRFFLYHIWHMAETHSRIKVVHWWMWPIDKHWLRKVLVSFGSNSRCCLIFTNDHRFVCVILCLWLLPFWN